MNDEIDHLLFEDECMIRDYQALQRTWFEKGKQRIIPRTRKHRGVKLLGTVDYVTGEIVMVLDNTRIHYAKLLKPFLAEMNGRLEFAFLLPYSPQFNIVEGLMEMVEI